MRRPDIRKTIPPPALLGDDLRDTFGQREMEVAVEEIVKRAVAEKSWMVKFTHADFDLPYDKANYILDGFNNLVNYNWLEPVNGNGEYQVTFSLVSRLRKRRLEAFQEVKI